MVSSNTYSINGFDFTFTAGGWEIDGITIAPSTDVSKEGFLAALQIALALYPDYYDYGVRTDYYEVYHPSNRDVPEYAAGYRQSLTTLLYESSIRQRNAHQHRMADYNKPKPKKSKPGYIYLIRAITPDNQYKIGLSKAPVTRIESMGVKLPFPIEPLHTFPTNDMALAEKTLHNRYADKRINGEWFALSEQDVFEICSIEGLEFEGAQS